MMEDYANLHRYILSNLSCPYSFYIVHPMLDDIIHIIQS